MNKVFSADATNKFHSKLFILFVLQQAKVLKQNLVVSIEELTEKLGNSEKELKSLQENSSTTSSKMNRLDFEQVRKLHCRLAAILLTSIWQTHDNTSRRYLVWWCYPTPSEGWGHREIPRRLNSSATLQGLDKRSEMEEVVPKMARKLHQRLAASSWWTSGAIPPLYREAGRNGRSNLPKESNHPVDPQSSSYVALRCGVKLKFDSALLYLAVTTNQVGLRIYARESSNLMSVL